MAQIAPDSYTPGMIALRAGAVLAATALSVSLTAGAAGAIVPAKKGKQTVSGSISWSITITKVDDSDPSDLSRTVETSTTQQEHRLQVNAVRDPKYTRTYVFKRGKADYNYSYSETRVTKNYTMGAQTCETTTENANGTGKTDMNPSIFGKYNPNKDVLVIDKRTKGISVGAVLPATGTSTTVFRGMGTSPCEDGSYTDPAEETGSTSLNNSNNICLPSGMKTPSSSLRPLFGKWNNAKKRFDFNCSNSFTNGPTTTSIKISGSLKYKK